MAHELTKYRDLVTALIDYYLDSRVVDYQTDSFDSASHFNKLKADVQTYFERGDLDELRHLFHGLSEMHVDNMSLHINDYLFEKTGLAVDIIDEYIAHIELIISRGKIESDTEYLEMNSFIDKLYCDPESNREKIVIIRGLMDNYIQKSTVRGQGKIIG